MTQRPPSRQTEIGDLTPPPLDPSRAPSLTARERLLIRRKRDMSQFVAMKIAEAWKTYEEMLPDLEAMGAEVVPWKVYKRAVERNAIRLWNRSWRRDRRRPDNVPIHELVEEPAGPHPDRGHAQVEVEDLLDSLAEFVATAVRHRLDGYQVAEVAELMEVSVRTVERLLAAARGSITAEL